MIIIMIHTITFYVILNTQEIRSTPNSKTLAFGPDTTSKVKDFIPGVSSYYVDGGHSSITFVQQKKPTGGSGGSGGDNNDDIVINEIGNGVQFIKISPELLRLSK